MNKCLLFLLLTPVGQTLPGDEVLASDRKGQEAVAVERVLERVGQGTYQQALGRVIADKAATTWLRRRPANYAALIPPQIRELRIMSGPGVEKLHRLVSPVIILHEQAGVIEPILFRRDQIYLALVGGWHLAVSTGALVMLTEEELEAAAAHEIGHIYTMAEAYSAQKAKDEGKLREIELFGDAVSALSMEILGKDSTAVLRVIEKELSRTAARGAIALMSASHLTLESRRTLIKRLTQVLNNN